MSIEDRVANLEKRVAKLESASSQRPSKPASDVMPFVKLDEAWAHNPIERDPRIWDGPSYVGKTMAEAPPEYLDKVAGYYDWLADRKAREPEPKLDSKGKPYYERDRFLAKLARTWAAFHRSNVQSDSADPTDPGW